MPEQQPYQKQYTLADIEQYLQGKLSPALMHELEKAALQDSFLADAIDGYRSANLLAAREDLSDVYTQLAARQQASLKQIPITNSIRIWRMAAVFLLLVGAATISWYVLTGGNGNIEMAKNHPAPIQKKYLPDTVLKSVIAANKNVNPSKKDIRIVDSPKPEKNNLITDHQELNESIVLAKRNPVNDVSVSATQGESVQLISKRLPDSSVDSKNAPGLPEDRVLAGKAKGIAVLPDQKAKAFANSTEPDSFLVKKSVASVQLPAITVIGYGTSRKKDLTGSETGFSSLHVAATNDSALIVPISGWAAFKQYLFQQLSTDSSQLKNAGALQLELSLDKDGKITKAKTINSFSRRVNKKIIKALTSGPLWERKRKEIDEDVFPVFVRF